MSDPKQRSSSDAGENLTRPGWGSGERSAQRGPRRDSGAMPRADFAGTARFEIRRRIGAGGFGVVYEAFDRERRAPVALKALERNDAATIYRFKQEFRALSDIVHPNLVQLYELHNEGEAWFFTMELVEGGDAVGFVRDGTTTDPALAATQAATARTLVTRERTALSDRTTISIADEATLPASDDGPLRLDSAPPAAYRLPAAYDDVRLRAILRQLVEGLSALHDAGKLHRDIKPSNVLVGRDGRVVLVDFGLATSLSSSSEGSFNKTNLLAGTPVYMAPEQVAGGAPSPAWDWYAVGVMLFEALTGELPFTGTLVDVLRAKRSVDPPPPSALRDGIAPDLDRLCGALLSRSPEARPHAREMRQLLGMQAGSVRPAPTREGPFVGREAERRAIADALQTTVHDHAAVVALIGGPSGVGKSALVRRAREDLRASDPSAVFLAGRCYEQESVPYKAIDGLIDPLSRYLKQLPMAEVDALLPYDISALARLFPVLEQVEAVRDAPHLIPHADPREARRQAFRALRQLLGRLARGRPLCLFIDDLQWGDADSGALLVELLTPPDPPPLLFLATYRDEDREAPCLRALLPALPDMQGPSLRLVEIALANLAEQEATALARALLQADAQARPRLQANAEARPGSDPDAGEPGQSQEELCAAIARESGGRPFFVSELAHFARSRPPPSLRRRQGGAAALLSLDEIVRDRVAELPDSARRLLEVIAVAGRPIGRAAAARAASLDGEEPGAYTHLRTQRFLRLRDADGREELETYHDRIREAVTAGLSAEARTDCFRRLAAALDGADCDAETLAVYCVEAGELARAAQLAGKAAEEAASTLAFERAVRLYRMALDLRARSGSGDDAAASPLREALGVALVNAGRGAEAAELLLAAMNGSPPSRALDLRRRAAEQLLISGHIDRGLTELRELLAELRLRLPERPLFAAMGTVFWTLVLVVRGLHYKPRREEEIPPDALLRADTYASVSKSLSLVDTVRGGYFAIRSVFVALAVGEHLRILRALSLLVAFGGGTGGREPPRIVRKLHDLARRMLEETDDPHAHALLRMCEGIASIFRGSFREAEEDLVRAAAILRGRCTGATWEIDTAEQFQLVSLTWRGLWKEVAARLPELVGAARARGDLYAATSHTLSVGHIPALLADDPAGAEATLREALSAWSRQQFNVQHYYFTFAMAEVHLYAERGRGAVAARHLAAAWPELERSLLVGFQLPRVEMTYARFRALVALAADDASPEDERRRALAMARRIAARLDAVRVSWARGFALLARATLAAEGGRRGEAITLLVSAEEALAAADLAHFAAAARRRRGELTGEAEGRALVEAADAWMAEQGARDPARAVSMLMPGRWTS